MSTGLNLFFITHGYNTLLLDYNITRRRRYKKPRYAYPRGNREWDS